MRDPKRIDEMLNRLKVAWSKRPELRLGQLVITAYEYGDTPGALFYMEDDKLIAAIEGFVKPVEVVTAGVVHGERAVL